MYPPDPLRTTRLPGPHLGPVSLEYSWMPRSMASRGMFSIHSHCPDFSVSFFLAPAANRATLMLLATCRKPGRKGHCPIHGKYKAPQNHGMRWLPLEDHPDWRIRHLSQPTCAGFPLRPSPRFFSLAEV
ncbi:hypothetical protein H696_01229 [Fonticula alba]|uniref:Uncharacterized protein n=1 Tax=Fonticula alba TaxID=691883 RepID=A0A058ZCZ6_FONAL|nr:hypothetical protein H696_01229 [Fonticula alba]KCV71811.1 hypothetical protein H696_01229 [Fonticula alba]|eukprot:XP_009493389.1 hypothetical protein H696_01229 [Fonticula alba]